MVVLLRQGENVVDASWSRLSEPTEYAHSCRSGRLQSSRRKSMGQSRYSSWGGSRMDDAMCRWRNSVFVGGVHGRGIEFA